METAKKLPLIKSFRSAKTWASWLAKQHEKSDGIWIRIFKKGSGLPTVTHPEALEISLCYGWIDAQRKGFDDESFIQRFTPRRKGSIWSEINRDKALRLIREKKMQPSGIRAIEEAKKNGRWDNAYPPQKSTILPKDLEIALGKNPKAAAFFKTLKGQNRYAIIFRVQTTRNLETRARKIQTFIEMLKAGKTIYPPNSR